MGKAIEYNEENYRVSEDEIQVNECYIATFKSGLECNIFVTEIYIDAGGRKIVKGTDANDKVVEINCEDVVRWIC